jgi:hypothetical protein
LVLNIVVATVLQLLLGQRGAQKEGPVLSESAQRP